MSENQAHKTFVLLGDVMLGRGVNEVLKEVPPAYVWGDTLSTLKAADFSLINLECALTLYDEIWLKTLKAFYFKADPGPAIAAMKEANIACVCLANNHTLDFQEQGLLDTLRYLDDAGICRAGAGENLDEARSPAYKTVGDITVGLVAFTDNEPDFAATPNAPGVNFAVVDPKSRTLKPIVAAVEKARERADIVIVSAHWGPNMRFHPQREFREVAHLLVDAGADIFHGHSAHNFQGIEIYKGRPIFYDTGDFIDDYAVDPFYRNDQSFIFALKLSGAHIVGIDLYPVHLSYAQTNLATGTEFGEIAARMEKLSAEFGTQIERHEDRLTVAMGKRMEERVS